MGGRRTEASQWLDRGQFGGDGAPVLGGHSSQAVLQSNFSLSRRGPEKPWATWGVSRVGVCFQRGGGGLTD